MLAGIDKGSDIDGNAWNDISVYTFRIIGAMLQGSSDAFKFSRINERGSSKRRDKGFEQIVDFFQNKPHLVMRASCAWYKTLGIPQILEVLISFAMTHPQAFQSSVDAADPDIGKFAVDRVLLHLHLAVENYGIPPGSSEEWNYITHSKFIGLLDRLPDQAARTFFEPSAVHMYKKLSAFYDTFSSDLAKGGDGSLVHVTGKTVAVLYEFLHYLRRQTKSLTCDAVCCSKYEFTFGRPLLITCGSQGTRTLKVYPSAANAKSLDTVGPSLSTSPPFIAY